MLGENLANVRSVSKTTTLLPDYNLSTEAYLKMMPTIFVIRTNQPKKGTTSCKKESNSQVSDVLVKKQNRRYLRKFPK